MREPFKRRQLLTEWRLKELMLNSHCTSDSHLWKRSVALGEEELVQKLAEETLPPELSAEFLHKLKSGGHHSAEYGLCR